MTSSIHIGNIIVRIKRNANSGERMSFIDELQVQTMGKDSHGDSKAQDLINMARCSFGTAQAAYVALEELVLDHEIDDEDEEQEDEEEDEQRAVEEGDAWFTESGESMAFPYLRESFLQAVGAGASFNHGEIALMAILYAPAHRNTNFELDMEELEIASNPYLALPQLLLARALTETDEVARVLYLKIVSNLLGIVRAELYAEVHIVDEDDKFSMMLRHDTIEGIVSLVNEAPTLSLAVRESPEFLDDLLFFLTKEDWRERMKGGHHVSERNEQWEKVQEP